MTSATRIAASRLNTRNANSRVSHSKALSIQRAGCTRRGPDGAPEDVWVVVKFSGMGRTALTGAPANSKGSVQRLAALVLDLLLPGRADQVDHGVGHRHVVELGGHLAAVLERPVEELEHFP